MKNSFTISTTLPVSPEKLYNDWVDSKAHAKFTGSPARIAASVGGAFFAWDGYISGKTLEMEPPRRIVQAWRTTEFPDTAPDSIVEVVFKKKGPGTLVTIKHRNIPEGQADDYKQGWKDFYFSPMKEHYSE